MNKLMLKAGKVLAGTAIKVTSANVNSVCNFITYQPKLPANAKKLEKK